MRTSNIDTGGGNPKDIPVNLEFGLKEHKCIQHHKKKIRCICKLKDDMFASSDGTYLMIWSPTKLYHQKFLSCIGICYVPEFNQIIAYVENSTQLHFIKVKPPYKVIKHNLPFSNKILTNFFYFKRSSTLISSGQGLMFTKIDMPYSAAKSMPQPDVFEFSKIAELYQSDVFTMKRSPIPIFEKELIVVWLGNCIYIHNHDGELINKLLNVTTTPISFVSYYPETDSITMADESGNVTITQTKYSVVTDCQKYRMTNITLLYCGLFDKNFILSVDSTGIIMIFCIKNMSIVFQKQLDDVPKYVFSFDNLLLILTNLTVILFDIHIFLRSYFSAASWSVDLTWKPSLKESAAIMNITIDGGFSIFDPTEKLTMFGIESLQYSTPIEKYLYFRDVLVDGRDFIKAEEMERFLFLINDKLVVAYKSKNNKANEKAKEMFNPLSKRSFNDYNFDFIEIPHNKNVAMIQISENESLIIQKSSHCHIFNIKTLEITENLYLSIQNINFALTCFHQNIVLLVTYKEIYIFDIATRRVIKHKYAPDITKMLMINQDTMVCSLTSNDLEIRTVPQLEVIAKVTPHHEINYLSEKLEINKLDYCPTRRAILCFFNNGEIYVYTEMLELIAQLTLPFQITACAFFDGTGTLIVSAFESFFLIDSSFIFNTYIEKLPTDLDHFDLRKNTSLIKEQKLESKRRKEIIANMIHINKTFEVQKSHKVDDFKEENKKQSRANRVNQIFDVVYNQFDELLVDEEIFPKSYFHESRKWSGEWTPKEKPLKKLLSAQPSFNSITYRRSGLSNTDDLDSNSNRSKSGSRRGKSFIHSRNRLSQGKSIKTSSSQDNLKINFGDVELNTRLNSQIPKVTSLLGGFGQLQLGKKNEDPRKPHFDFNFSNNSPPKQLEEPDKVDENKTKKKTKSKNRRGKSKSVEVKSPDEPKDEANNSIRRKILSNKKSPRQKFIKNKSEMDNNSQLKVEKSDADSFITMQEVSLVATEEFEVRPPETVDAEVQTDLSKSARRRKSRRSSSASSSSTARKRRSSSCSSTSSKKSDNVVKVLLPTKKAENGPDPNLYLHNTKHKAFSTFAKNKEEKKRRNSFAEPPPKPKYPLLRIMNYGNKEKMEPIPFRLMDDRSRHMIQMSQYHAPSRRIIIHDNTTEVLQQIREDIKTFYKIF